jgi:hypothetical protein
VAASGPGSTAREVEDVLARINAAWRGGRPRDMAPHLDPRVVMAFPGFTGCLEGAGALIESYESFSREARVLEYRQGEVRVDGSGSVAVAHYPFEMVYERGAGRWRSKGTDLWVFERRDAGWIAIWRTMQALSEEPVPPS